MATIRKRGNLQWEAQIRKKGFAPVSKTFLTRAEAEDWAKTSESEMVRGVFLDRTEAEATTLYEALDRYCAEVSVHKKSYSAEVTRINKWKKDQLAKRSMASLRSADFAQWRDARLKDVKPATVKLDLAVISHLFTVATKDWGLAVGNPVKNIRMPSIKNARERRLEGDEEHRLLDALGDSGKGTAANHWMRPLAILAIETAMRQGELLSLEWRHVDLTKRTAHLPDTKNGTSRTIPLSSRAIQTLTSLPRSIGGTVFPTSQQAVIQSFVRACKRAGIEGLTFHDLRHEATSRLADKFQMHQLMKITGHKDTKMLGRYYHPRAEDLAKVLA